MDILTDVLPDFIELYGVKYPVYSDFRVGILLSELFSDSRADSAQKVSLALRALSPALYGAVCRGTVDAEGAFYKVMWFYTLGEYGCGKVGKCRGNGDRLNSGGETVFDFSYDSERIFAAFMQVYHMDLTKVHIHWWKFMALLRSLPAECELMRIIKLRLTDTSKIADDETRRRVRRAKSMVRVRKNTEKRDYIG